MFSPRDFLELADELVQSPGKFPEATARTVISRSYYSCFLETRKELERALLSTPAGTKLSSLIRSRRQQHRLVESLVKAIDGPSGMRYSDLRMARSAVDYDLVDAQVLDEYITPDNALDLARRVVADARAFFQRVKWLTEDNRVKSRYKSIDRTIGQFNSNPMFA